EANLAHSMPEYFLIWNDSLAQDYLKTLPGYVPSLENRFGDSGLPCVYHNPNALPYAYVLPAESRPIQIPYQTPIPFYGDFYEIASFPPGTVKPIRAFNPAPDVIAALVTEARGDGLVFTAQERAYPGWGATIN